MTESAADTSTSRAALLHSTIEAIDEFGESGVRMEEVARRAGMSVASIYHWFGSKRELIEAAQRMRFDEVWDSTMIAAVDRFRTQVGRAGDPDRARRQLFEFTGGLRDGVNDGSRMARLMLIGTCIHQPELRHLVTANYRAYLDTGAESLALSMEEAKFRTDLDLRASAAWLHNQALSRRVGELVAEALAPERSDPFRDQAMAWTLWGYPLTAQSAASSSAPSETSTRRNDQHRTAEPSDPTPSRCATNGDGDAEPLASHSTERLILDRVIEHLDRHGEGSLRLRQITRDLHFSETVIHRYFGGREGLIIRAQAERFEQSLGVDLTAFDDAVRACDEAHEFLTVFRVMLRSRLSEAKRSIRLRRLNALAAAYRRPELAAAHSTRLDLEGRALAGAIGHAKERGWLTESLDTVGYASWLNSVCTVHACFELDDMGLQPDAYRSMVIDCAVDLLITEPIEVG